MNLITIIATLVITPFNAPHVDFPNLPLEKQMAVIEVWRPDPIVLPVMFSPGRAVPAVPALPPAQVEALIRQYFQPADVEWALRVSWCESNWRPDAYNPSGASGLFQHMKQYWVDRSAAAGWPGASIWDAEANTAVAAWLYYSGGAGHWVCK